MTAQALVFDLGGVLVDVDFGRAFAAWGAAAGVPAAALAARFSVDDACCAHERGAIDDAAYFAHLRRSLGIELSNEQMLAGWNAIIGEPMPGIEALVRALAERLPLYVFSNTNPAHVAHFTPRSEDEHRLIMIAVRKRNAKAALAALSEHILAAGRALAAMLENAQQAPRKADKRRSRSA